MKSDELFTHLYLDRIDHSEFSSFLVTFLHSSMIDDHQVAYADGQNPTSEEYGLLLSYDEDTIKSIKVGAQWTSADLETLRRRIYDNLIADETYGIGAKVLFTNSMQVNGYWRFQDILQISPPPPVAPTLPHVFGQHPFVLEVKYAACPYGPARVRRLERQARQIGLVLNVVLEGGITVPSRVTQHAWVTPFSGDDEGKSIFGPETYHIPDFVIDRTEFSSTVELPRLRLVPPQDYYGSLSQQLELPANLSAYISSYLSLPRESQDKFLRACYWFHHCDQVWLLSSSAAFMALITAVEVLLPEHSETCATCGQARYRLTKRFRDFMEQYAPTPDSRTRRRLYDVRSQLVHGSRLISLDLDPGIGFTGLNYQEGSDFAYAQRSVRIALCNWLLSSSNAPTTPSARED